jgi:bifunctional DNA-binding transcriptional regulator/antitoxin component of YhaV-PrlF toxin-antitoxin module
MRELTMEQLREFIGLNKGDKVLLTDGSEAIFVRSKQVKFIGTMEGKDFDIPKTMYVKTLEKVKVDSPKEKQDKNLAKIKLLKKGDWFYIERGNNAELYKFEELQNNTIIGINPIDQTRMKIHVTFQIGLVS